MNIRLITLGRLSDGLAVASYKRNDTTKAEVEATVSRVLSSGNIKPNSQLTVVINEDIGTLHLASGEADVISVVTSSTYPRRSAFQLLEELRVKMESQAPAQELQACSKQDQLSKKCQPWLREVFIRYSSLENVDKLSHVEIQVDEVKTVMEANINRILDNAEALSSVDDKAESLRQNASQFQKQSVTLRRILW
eukprot:CAMPEP_0196588266 /NCGR_PEP_ID=MMETSP1081-20130531/60041_1 /TAXON_ID=36882 /ORGANISM="Pyramimonas amylifera, Strain CCMP720" /LENGTH=193 /DNA_ID=CAMNT_0041910715 /DNA_START=59 /DNA_END=637 /DNA_ORIENTATION=+